MKIDFLRLGRLLSPEIEFFKQRTISHASNPVVVPLCETLCRLFFNARDERNRSEVYSLDFDISTFKVVEGSLKQQLGVGLSTPSYCRDGISLGSYFELNSKKYLGFMGWHVPAGQHWVGEIGLLELDDRLNVVELGRSPWIPISDEDPISLSYPEVTFENDRTFVWYGTTKSWDAGNGEMLHVIERSEISPTGKVSKTHTTVDFVLGKAQAFSRPSFVKFQNVNLLGYSVRGNSDKYRIAIREVTYSDSYCNFESAFSFEPEGSDWESEMVEYPFLFKFKEKLYMFYNGNGYGKTGIGVCQLLISD